MQLLIIAETCCDLIEVLTRCPVRTEVVSFVQAIQTDTAPYDAFCVLGNDTVLDARLRNKLEEEADRGKRIFLESVNAFRSIYSMPPQDTTRSRLIYVKPEDGDGIPGLETGDLLDDEAGRTITPWFTVPDTVPLLVYKEQVIAHTHTDMSPEDIRKNGKAALIRIGGNVLMAMFSMHNFVKARFAPRGNWEKLVRYIAMFLTGTEPASLPEPVVRYGTAEDLRDPAAWERARDEALKNGIRWLENFLVDEGRGGLREGLRHSISPEGVQSRLNCVRTDCCGESAGAFAMYGFRTGCARAAASAEKIRRFFHENMTVRRAPFEGMLRWTETGWDVCYPDDAARAVIPELFGALFMDDDRYFDEICRTLDFLLKTTCRDGLAQARTDIWNIGAERLTELQGQEHGLPSAHYNAYYHAALLLAYKKCGKAEYLDTARRGLETLMRLYPETRREQSETEEMCRLILPLSVLYDVTGEEKHKEYLYRVVRDLETHRHPFGGYREWDTGYKASCSRESTGECSLLTENGDPVTDSLYSVNWLPVGFAYAWYATGDPALYGLWKDAVTFFLRTQMFSADPMLHGGWCRAFDMDLREAYGCPHDVGWAAYCCETGWTAAEILMGMMLADILAKHPRR